MGMFSMGGRSKSKHKSGGTKFCEAKEVRKYFVNPKIENGALDFRNISCSTNKNILSKAFLKYHVSM